MKLTVKYFSTITMFLLAFAQTANAGTAIDDGASGLVPIQLTRIKGDPAIGVHQLTLPGENPGDKDGFMRCLALSYIGAYPEILAQSNTALSVAIVYLTTEAQSRFVNDVGLPAIYRDWKGANEFQRERTYRSFIDEFGPTIAANAESAPKPPFDFWVISPATLGPYDFDRGGYKMYGPDIAKPFHIRHDGHVMGRALSDESSLKHHVYYANTSNEITVPRFMPIAADKAEKITNLLAQQDNRDRIYFSAHMRVLSTVTGDSTYRHLTNTVGNLSSGLFFIEFRSLALYADPDLTYLIHQYDAPTPIAAK